MKSIIKTGQDIKRTIIYTMALFPGMAAALHAATIDDAPRDSFRLDEVVVTGSRTPVDVRHAPLTVTSLSRQQIAQSYEPSLLPLLNEQVPGVFVTRRGVMGYGVSTGAAGGIKVRGIGGSPTTEMMVLVDGVPHYTSLMGHTVADLYQSMVAERVEVVRGPASVLYGSNAMGGVMNIITRQSAADGSRTWRLGNDIRLQGGSYGTMNGEYAGTQSYRGFSNMIGLSGSSSDGHRKNMHFEQYSLVDNMALRLSPHFKARGEVNLTHFLSHNPGMVSAPMIDNYMNIHRGVASVGLDNHYGNARGSVTYYLDWGHHRIDDGHLASAPAQTAFYKQSDFTHGVNLFETFSLMEGNATTLGFDYQHVRGSAWTEGKTDGKRSYYADGRQTDEIAGYVDFRQALWQWLTLDAALRYNHHSIAGSELIPQFGLSLTPLQTAVLKMTVSKGFRNPTMRELYMFKPANAELQAERLWNYELSWHHDMGVFDYGANLFYIDADNLIQTERIEGKPLNVNSGKLYHWGGELTAAYRANTHLQLNANYSYLHTSKAITAAPRHKLYVGGDYHTGPWRLSTGLQWIGHLLTSTAADSEVQNYVLWNASTSYQATRWLNIFAKGENLLAQRYETYEGFTMPRATVMAGVDIRF